MCKVPETLKDDFNPSHRPSQKFDDLLLPKGHLALWRPPAPSEKKIGSIIRPDGDKIEYKFGPNCALVVAVGPECETEIGEYVFWINDGLDEKKPMRLVADFQDERPAVFVLKEEYVIASTCGAHD